MTEYWHGGPANLKGWILPSRETKAHSNADMPVKGAEVCRRDCVYVTTNRLAAEMFAAMAPSKKASVYLVEPAEPIERDEDCDDAELSFRAPRARILREFRMRPARRREVFQAVVGRGA